MSELPNSWVDALLGDISHVEMGQSPDSRFYNDRSEGLPFFQGKAEFGALYPTVRKWCSEPTKTAEAGDILLSVRAPVGPTNLAEEKCCIVRGLAAIRADEPIGQKYLLHYFRHIQPWLSEQGTGTTFTAVSGDFLRALKVTVAPTNEQKHIADKLDAILAGVDACRERLDRVPGILMRFRQAVLAAATSGKLTEDWREETKPSVEWRHTIVGSLLTDIRYGTAKKCLYEPKKTPVLRIPNILDGRVNHDDMKYAEFEKEEFRKLVLVAGDILMIRSNGSLGLVGRTALITEQEEGFLYAGYLIRVRVNHALARPAYLSISLASPESRDAIERVARSTSGVNNINTEEIKALAISVPGVEEQDEIIHRVEALFAYADRLEARYTVARTHVERLTPALLAKAFRGELVPQDPNDEPASVLLERIRTARAASEGAADPKRRKGGGRPKTFQKAEVRMLTRKDIQDTHLTMILKDRGPLTPEALWSASQLDIDDFYDQLKDEEARGLLQEKRGDSSNAPRMLEAA